MTDNTNDTEDETYTVVLEDEDGTKQTFTNATIQTVEEAEEKARAIRDEAPDRVELTDRTADIDAVIDALQEAKEQGITEIYVNDDGVQRRPRVTIENNHRRHVATKPAPDELRKWVEL